MRRPPALLALAVSAAFAVWAPDAVMSRGAGPAAYRPILSSRNNGVVPSLDSTAARRRMAWRAAGSEAGLLSIGGLPPVAGTIGVTGGSLVFRPVDGAAVAYPLYRWIDHAGHSARRSAVTLLGIDRGRADPVYLFHLDGAVLETASPGILERLATDSSRVDSLGDAWAIMQRPLVDPSDSAGQIATLHDLMLTPYADSLFRLFGAPARPIGLVGERGQRAGRLGEFVASRDSVSLSPSRMTNPEQLRHALAHELAHRWQRNDPEEIRELWRGVPPIEDSLRYGYRNEGEHQAEAVAFAVHFLQTTASPDLPADGALDLLDAYERLVPGTAVMARHIVSQPLYRYHPLASVLLAPGSRVAARAGSSDTVDHF